MDGRRVPVQRGSRAVSLTHRGRCSCTFTPQHTFSKVMSLGPRDRVTEGKKQFVLNHHLKKTIFNVCEHEQPDWEEWEDSCPEELTSAGSDSALKDSKQDPKVQRTAAVVGRPRKEQLNHDSSTTVTSEVVQTGSASKITTIITVCSLSVWPLLIFLGKKAGSLFREEILTQGSFPGSIGRHNGRLCGCSALTPSTEATFS